MLETRTQKSLKRSSTNCACRPYMQRRDLKFPTSSTLYLPNRVYVSLSSFSKISLHISGMTIPASEFRANPDLAYHRRQVRPQNHRTMAFWHFLEPGAPKIHLDHVPLHASKPSLAYLHYFSLHNDRDLRNRSD